MPGKQRPTGTSALDVLLRRRRSVREYADTAITLHSLCRIMVSGQGITGADGERAAPSAHGLHPLTLYAVVRRVQDLAPGLYTYDPASERLALAGDPIPEGALLRASLADDTWLETAAAVVVIGADRQRALHHFADQQPDGLRGVRYIDFEAGAVTQNMHLRTVAEGLGGVPVMGLDYPLLKSALQLPDAVEPVALFCIGALPN